MSFHLSCHQFSLQAFHDAFTLSDRQPDGSRTDLILTFNRRYLALQRLSLSYFRDELDRPFHPASLLHPSTPQLCMLSAPSLIIDLVIGSNISAFSGIGRN